MYTCKPNPIFKKRWAKLIWWGLMPLTVFAFKNFLMAFHHPPDRLLPALLKGRQSGADVGAGRNRALLTLTNGETLTLNDSTYGELAEQGGVEILGRDDGMLIYRA